MAPQKTKPPQKTRPDNLREACILEALKIIENAGVEGLSLREVSRRLGVSHQAPYKHFPSRDHILAEIVSRAFDSFAAHLDARPVTGDAYQDLGSMGLAYFEYARAHPLQYRLMFGTPLPDPDEHPEMMSKASHAFALLRECVRRLPPPGAVSEEAADDDALFIWSTVHGLAGILQTRAIESTGFASEATNQPEHRILQRIGYALQAERSMRDSIDDAACEP